ncbi:helix-turn-helix domain-containing protein [Streptomyces neyagawaensis]|uniref:helix-turn-helix domain-containing protein n=1 Tax=Streptomyces neyagawaensis TaxID=42238 RepID=UPI0006E46B38|nr:helix-turn-helix domain-containing protein [Streptomyces neyagawaensis]MCL6731887.1 helix-turn-helix domain-containing protein [Streptomyces neyagawaensis]MDE1682621.1 helix-turn-helix domain-containing protein [Streptomyces neyagawaensis]
MSECTESERFAACLRSLKERSGLSYAALAAKAGTSGSSVHRYCLGGSVPQDYGTVHRLAVACGATPEELRTLHRLWALADAAREPEPTPSAAEPENAGREPRPAESEPLAPAPEPKAARQAPQAARPASESSRPEQPAARRASESSGPEREPEPEPDLVPEAGRQGPGTGVSEAPHGTVDASVAASGTGTGAGAVRSGGRRGRVALAVGLVVLFLGGMAWTLPSLGSAEDGDGPDKSAAAPGKKDSRTLFTPACREVVAMGQHDTCVREVQRLLEDKGAVIGVDGDFGPQTLRRVTAFQVIAGIEPPNGVVGDTTKRALYASEARMNTWTPDKVRKRIREVFTEEPDRAVAIADCQSFLDPLHILPNTNGTRNWGLFQISDARLRDLKGTPRQALDPEWNIRAAKRLWSEDRDFHDWPHCDRAFSPSPSPSR